MFKRDQEPSDTFSYFLLKFITFLTNLARDLQEIFSDCEIYLHTLMHFKSLPGISLGNGFLPMPFIEAA